MSELVVAVVGLGYVGLPLAVEFSKHFETVGFDVDGRRVGELKEGLDRTLEVSSSDLAGATRLSFTSEPGELDHADVLVVTVPTPIDRNKRPDLGHLEAASRTVGRALRPGNTVVYESTVFPGATEEICVPILEAESGLLLNEDFWVGYSPERANPGDKIHRLSSVVKVTSGSSLEAAEFVDSVYGKIIHAGTFRAASIRVAEAAKLIENTQRDVNIALMNELALLLARLGIDTNEVIEAANTKWNFLDFRPGLVGGHCIGVDPYYLTHKAAEVGHHPEIVLAGRRINDTMGTYIAEQVVLLLAQAGRSLRGSRIVVLGLAFKENVPDIRNSRVVDLVHRLRTYGAEVSVVDPLASPTDAAAEHDIKPLALNDLDGHYDATILAVNHDAFSVTDPCVRRLLEHSSVVYDIKGSLPPDLLTARL